MAAALTTISKTPAGAASLPSKPEPTLSSSDQKAKKSVVDILRRPWDHREYFTGAIGLACLVAGTVCVLTGIWIGKVAIIALIGLTLLGYAVKRWAVVHQHEKMAAI